MFKLIKIILVAMAALNLSGCLEASFTLSQESRLPKWLEAPAGVPRGNLKVTMDYYSTFSGGEYIFNFYDKNSFFRLKEIKVTLENVREIKPKEYPLGFPKGYPSYHAVTVNGITDIIERRKMEPIFYMSDNQEIWKALGVKN